MSRHFGIGKETVYGTPVVTTEFLELISESLQKEETTEEIEVVRSYSTRKIEQLNTIIRGDVEVILNYQDIGLLLKTFFGGNDTTGTDPYTHTFPPSTGIPDVGRIGFSLSAELKRDDALFWKYEGLKVIGIAIAASHDAVPRLTASFLGENEVTSASGDTATYPDFDVALPSHITVNFDATALDAESVNFNAGFAVDEPRKLGSKLLASEPDDLRLAVGGDVTVLFEDTTQYAKWDGATDVDVQIAITNGVDSLTFNMNKTRLTQTTPHMTGRERLKGTYNFLSYFDAVATENLQAILVNSDAIIP